MSRWILTCDGATILDVTTPGPVTLPPTVPTQPTPPSVPTGSGDIVNGGFVNFYSTSAADEREFPFTAPKARCLLATAPAPGGVGSLTDVVVSLYDAAGAEVLPPTVGMGGYMNAWMDLTPGAAYRFRVRLSTGGAVTVQVQ